MTRKNSSAAAARPTAWTRSAVRRRRPAAVRSTSAAALSSHRAPHASMSIDAPMTDQSVLAREARLQADQGRERNRKGDGQTDRARRTMRGHHPARRPRSRPATRSSDPLGADGPLRNWPARVVNRRLRANTPTANTIQNPTIRLSGMHRICASERTGASSSALNQMGIRRPVTAGTARSFASTSAPFNARSIGSRKVAPPGSTWPSAHDTRAPALTSVSSTRSMTNSAAW